MYISMLSEAFQCKKSFSMYIVTSIMLKPEHLMFTKTMTLFPKLVFSKSLFNWSCMNELLCYKHPYTYIHIQCRFTANEWFDWADKLKQRFGYIIWFKFSHQNTNKDKRKPLIKYVTLILCFVILPFIPLEMFDNAIVQDFLPLYAVCLQLIWKAVWIRPGWSSASLTYSTITNWR